MLAIDHEQFGHSTVNEYLTLFHGYISRSIEAIYGRVAPELEELSTETREQAWHILSYGLKLTNGWEAVRKLLLALAPRMERDGFRHEWLPYLESGVACSRRVHDISGEAQLSLYIGRLYRLRGEFEEAHTWFAASATLCQQVGDQRGRAMALNQLGYVARLQSRYAEAKANVDEALSLLQELDSERATSFSWLGAIAYDQMDWVLAEQHYRTACQIWQDAGDQQRAAWSLQNLGNTLRGAGKDDEAAAYIQQAIVLLGQLHDPVNQAIARMNLGILLEHQQRLHEALGLFQLAEPVFRQAQDLLHLAMVCNNIAVLERGLGHWQAAEQAAQRGVQLWEALDDPKSLANTMDELGLAYLAQERYREAIAVFERALSLLSQVPPGPIHTMLRDMLLPHLAEARRGESA